MARDVASYLIRAEDQTQGALNSAKAGLRGLQTDLQGVKSAFQGIGSLLGAGFLGVSVGGFVAGLKSTIAELGSLDGAAEQTGASVENLSRIFYSIKDSGVTVETLAAGMAKLAQSMVQAQDPTSRQAQVFRALGVEIEKSPGVLRDTAEAYEDLAKSLGRFEDGTNKVANAQAIFGKGAGEQISAMKDLAESTGATARVTAETVAAADRFEKSMRRLSQASDQFKIDVADKIVPGLTLMIESFNRARAAGSGFFEALGQSIGSPERQVQSINQMSEALARLEENKARIASGPAANKDALVGDIDRQIDEVRRKLQRAQSNLQAELDTVRVKPPEIKPEAPLPPPELEKGSVDKAGDRLLAQLRSELAAKQQLNEVEKLRIKLANELKGKLSEPERDKALALATLIDLTREHEEAEKRRIALAGQYTAAVDKEIDAALKEQDALNPVIESIRRRYELEQAESAMLNETQTQRAARIALLDLERAGIDRASEAYQGLLVQVERGQKSVRLVQLLDESEGAKLEKARDDMRLLAEEYQRYLDTGGEKGISRLQFEDAATARLQLKGVSDDMKDAQSSAREFGQVWTSMFEDALFSGEKFSSVLKSLAIDMAKLIIRQELFKPFQESLAGGAKGGDGSTWFSALVGLFGGERAGGGAVGANRAYLVGEQGPELFFPGRSGTVIPNERSGMGGGNFTIHQQISVGRGADQSMIFAAVAAANERTKADILSSRRRGGAFA